MKAVLGKLNGEQLLNHALGSARFSTEVDAAVAYADSSDHRLLQTCKEQNQKLTFYGLLDEGGAVGVSFLKELLSWRSKATVRLVNGNFHAKVIWWRGYGAYVGSANLTHKAWFTNIEAGVFLDEDELAETGVGDDLDILFDYLGRNSIAVNTEMIEKLATLAAASRARVDEEKKLRRKFEELFGHLPKNQGLTVAPPKGTKVNTALQRFSVEWMETLQRMRSLSLEFAALDLRPSWVARDAHPAVHFDQFLHAYYYGYVRASKRGEDDESTTGMDKVQAAYGANKNNPSRALRVAAEWWAGLEREVYGEEDFIRVTAGQMRQRLSRQAVANMDVSAFKEAFRHVNAFRMHARQVKNSVYGLALGHHEDIDTKVDRLCDWLWAQRTSTGRTVRDVIEYVLWGSTPADMEQRLWVGVFGKEFRLPHFGKSSLGEAVGWARPDEYPPRNNRTNKALHALGHKVIFF